MEARDVLQGFDTAAKAKADEDAARERSFQERNAHIEQNGRYVREVFERQQTLKPTIKSILHTVGFSEEMSEHKFFVDLTSPKHRSLTRKSNLIAIGQENDRKVFASVFEKEVAEPHRIRRNIFRRAETVYVPNGHILQFGVSFYVQEPGAEQPVYAESGSCSSIQDWSLMGEGPILELTDFELGHEYENGGLKYKANEEFQKGLHNAIELVYEKSGACIGNRVEM